jgi:hypothetical protein
MGPWNLAGAGRRAAKGGYVGVLKVKNMQNGITKTLNAPLAVTE